MRVILTTLPLGPLSRAKKPKTTVGPALALALDMTSVMDPRVRTFAPTSFGTGTDVAMINRLWAAIVRAAQLQLTQQPQLATPLAPLNGMTNLTGAQGFAGAPTLNTGRTLPTVLGGGRPLPGALGGYRSMGGFGNGAVDYGSLLRQQLLKALPSNMNPALMGQIPPGYGALGAVSPYDCPPLSPYDCPPLSAYDCPPVSSYDCPPVSSDSSSEDSGAPGKKVFILGDLKKFGGTTVRRGLEDMLRSLTQADRRGERTHSKISAEDAQKIRALLDSKDPEIMKTMSMKVPDKKSLVIGEDGALIDTLDTNEIINNASLGVAEHADHMNDRGLNFDRSAGGKVQAAGQTYDVAGTELHSPIKIALDGKNAQLNSSNGFAIDLNGFDEKGGQTTTSGGLNANEAWLVRDRAGDGIKKNGVVDGDDVYGDHNGKRKDGYDDLARDFADEIKTDPRTGARYIDLTDPKSRAAKELQLLDAQGNLRPAKDVLNRIDVSATAANERDSKGNVITARANVTYKDGHTATSADQWFSTPANAAGNTTAAKRPAAPAARAPAPRAPVAAPRTAAAAPKAAAPKAPAPPKAPASAEVAVPKTAYRR